MDTLIVQVHGRGARGASLTRCAGDGLTLGRGYRNDIVLDDPFVGIDQLRFRRLDGRWELEILDRTNPVLVNGAPCHAATVPLRDGDRITVGRTDLSVHGEDHAVEPTRRLLFSTWITAHRIGPLLALAVLVTGSVLDAVAEFSFQSTDLEWRKHAFSALFSAVFIAVWAGVWALLGRALRHQTHYFAQMLVSTAVSIGATLLLPLGGIAEFLSSREQVGEAATYLIAIVCMTALLGSNLFLATNIRRTARVAAVFSLCAAGLFYIGNHYQDESFQRKPAYSRLVLPPALHLGGTRSIDEFIAQVPTIPAEE